MVTKKILPFVLIVAMGTKNAFIPSNTGLILVSPLFFLISFVLININKEIHANSPVRNYYLK